MRLTIRVLSTYKGVWENSSLSQQLLMPVALQLLWIFVSLSLQKSGILLQAIMLLQSYGTTSWSCPEDTILQESSQSSGFYDFSASSSVIFSLSVSGVTDAPFRDEHFKVTYVWHFDQLSVIVSVCWKKKLL